MENLMDDKVKSQNPRRTFLKQFAVGTAASVGVSLIPTKTEAKSKGSKKEQETIMGVLFDATLCAGCRNCERACKIAHDFPVGDIETFRDRSVYKEYRRPTPDGHTVVNEFSCGGVAALPIDVKVQCMHCNEPACASACIVGAITKNENGAVTWDTDMCIGCRYCMVACPFQIPTFEFEKAIQPKIQKCDLCFERTKVGKIPACVENCPMGALTYGPREELLQLAKEKIERYPDKYYHHVFGEHEVGGTSWLYVAPVEFSELKFPPVDDSPAPGVTEAIQHGIFAYFIPPLALFSWLGGVMYVSNRKNKPTENKEIDGDKK
jgi:Fe-S-cluster-containing dehydrogenase component